MSSRFGFLETNKRIADMAHVFGLPMANHNTGSQVYTYAAVQWITEASGVETSQSVPHTVKPANQSEVQH